jgi:hypothetical protein
MESKDKEDINATDFKNIQTHMHTAAHMHVYIYTYLCEFVCMCIHTQTEMKL